MTRTVLLVGLALTAAGLLAACGRIQAGQSQETAGIRIDLAVEPSAPAAGPARLTVTLTGPDGQPIPNATVEVEGNMTHAGMVPVFGQATGGNNGRYVVPFEWTMGGDWLVTVKATLENGQTISREFPVVVK